jgi:antitoxin VapB
MQKAKLFKNGQSQAVRLPKEFRFQGSEVYIHKIGHAVVMLPKGKPWESLFISLEKFTPDYLEDRNEPEVQSRKKIFK